MIRINPYEIMLLIEPEVAEERHTEIIERTKATVTEGGGTWHGVEPWGKRKLAYEINHHDRRLLLRADVRRARPGARGGDARASDHRRRAALHGGREAARQGGGSSRRQAEEPGGRGVGLTHRPVAPLLYTNVRS